MQRSRSIGRRINLEADIGGGVCRDSISDLPDSILVTILSLLPINEAARSTTLASRWRRLFSSMPLDVKVVTTDRAAVRARVRSLIPTDFCFPSSDLDGLLQGLAGRGVDEVSISFSFSFSYTVIRQKIPASLFACASLTCLQVSDGIFPETPTPTPLARLAEIDLSSVTISEGSLNSLLSECMSLEYLTISGVSECRRVHVRSPKLKVLRSCGDFEELLVEDAPNLEYLLGNLKRVHLKIAHAPKLEFLGYLNTSLHSIEIVDTMFKAIMPCLKTLAVGVSYTREGYIDSFVQLLTLCPSLETLYIKSDTWSMVQAAAPGSWEALSVPSCIENHLEKVVFEVYRGHEWQREMAKFLHGRSRFLKTMEFHCWVDTVGAEPSKLPSEEWVRKQRELLCLDGRASRDARFQFFSHMLVCNHQYICYHEWYQRKYYDNLLCEV